MRYVYDTEFIEDGKSIDLISIGIVAEDGREYYAVNGDVFWDRLYEESFSWVLENVWRHIPTVSLGDIAIDHKHQDVKPKARIAAEVKDFLLYGYAFPTPEYQEPHKIGEPELWADFCAYDHVAICQLWGRMVDLPQGIPYRTNDIMQLADFLGASESDFPKQDDEFTHHALHDARHNYRILSRMLHSTIPNQPPSNGGSEILAWRKA